MPDRGDTYPALLELTLARLREFIREPEAVFWVFVFPILMTCALGVAFRSRGDQSSVVAVVDGPGRAAVEAALTGVPGITVSTLPPGEVDRALQRSDVQLVIEPGTRPTYRFDPTRAESRLARRAVDEALQRAAGRHDQFTARDQPVETVGSRYIDWLVPGLLGMNIMSTGLWGLGFSIVTARTRKLLKRLVASPMSRRDYLLAQLFGRLVFLVVEVGALLAFSRIFRPFIRLSLDRDVGAIPIWVRLAQQETEQGTMIVLHEVRHGSAGVPPARSDQMPRLPFWQRGFAT